MPGQRALAAIVFTDVVGFSRHAAANEPTTYAAMNRDFALFSRISDEHHGRVANTAGDSMLMVFGSAVDAMNCALAIQTALFLQTQSSPPDGVLAHRIGVHIGDVLLSATNVFGDGVNVASRIQEICRPGAIAYSRAVSELIQGKVQTKGVYLGPRRAKNIGDAIPVWEIPTIVDQRRAHLDEALSPSLSASSRPAEATGGRSAAFLIMAGVFLAGGVALMFTVKRGANQPVRLRTSVDRSVRPTPPPLVNSATPATNEVVNNSGPVTASPEVDSGVHTVSGVEQIRGQLQEMKSRYDFDGILALLSEVMKGPMAPQDGNVIGMVRRRFELLSMLRQWADTELKALPNEPPLTLSDGNVIEATSGAMTIRGKDGPSKSLDLWTLSPTAIRDVLAGLDDRPTRTFVCPTGAIDAFADEYGIGTGTAYL